MSLLALFGTASAARADVGFAETTIPRPNEAPIKVAIWYPSTGKASDQPLGLFVQRVSPNAPVKGHHLPLIVVSHGTGGTRDGHYDTALALAEAGFVVAALEHPGDNYRDQSRATAIADRPAALSRLIDFMTKSWDGSRLIDPKRIGAFGFSAGGFTVLAAAGGQPDFGLFGPHCAAHPKLFDCVLLGRQASPASPGNFIADPRIKALVVAAPALGFTFARGLSSVRIPVQLWRADADEILPAPDYADAVHAALPVAPQFETVANAGHFDFLAPCSTSLAAVAPSICTSRPGFDRALFHKRFNRSVTRFFRNALK
ncbi:MAG: prolyl oligopeptidase family serine peptidase [Sphingomonas sp.]|nr:prolyl oligopeptidase family serine peptidase [Sphingomonas sp.]